MPYKGELQSHRHLCPGDWNRGLLSGHQTQVPKSATAALHCCEPWGDGPRAAAHSSKASCLTGTVPTEGVFSVLVKSPCMTCWVTYLFAQSTGVWNRGSSTYLRYEEGKRLIRREHDWLIDSSWRGVERCCCIPRGNDLWQAYSIRRP